MNIVKTVILAGGFGTRISEESHIKPKPMIEIGEQPVLWHILKMYSHFGFDDFVICLGYKQYVIKEYFANYFLHTSDIMLDIAANKMEMLKNHSEAWRVILADTGLNTMTGGRVKRVCDYVGNETFMITYGDGVSDINIKKVVDFHKSHGKKATISSYNIGQRFGTLDVDGNGKVLSFREKSNLDGSLVNVGFMVFEPDIFNYIDGDDTVFEKEPLERLVKEGELMTYCHEGFWQCMDTQRDKMKLEDLWRSGKAPWKVWND